MAHRTDQPAPQPSITVQNLDHYGSQWGVSTPEGAEQEITEARAEGATVAEWETTDRAGQPLRVVRVDYPKWGTDIRVFDPEACPAVAA